MLPSYMVRGFNLSVLVTLFLVFFGLFSNANVAASVIAGANSRVADTEVPKFPGLKFDNFGREVHLEREGLFYRVRANGLYVQLSPALIVKAKPWLKPLSILGLSYGIQDVKQLFIAPDYVYYHVLLGELSDLPQALNTFRHHKGIELVQPDLLQLGYQLPKSPSRPPGSLKLSAIPSINPSLKIMSEVSKPVLDSKPTSHSSSPATKAFVSVESTHNLSRKAHRVGGIDSAKSLAIDRRYLTYLQGIGVPSLWEKTKGQGVSIAIIDDGYRLDHPALAHVTPSFTYDLYAQKLSFEDGVNNSRHGTRVAGIILASHATGAYTPGMPPALVGGIAPEAQLIALRHSDTRTSKMLLAFQLAGLAGADIVNCSWHSHWLSEPVADAVNTLSTHGRKGKGIAVIFAAGNSGERIDNNVTEASIARAIVVAASDEYFVRLKNSNYGDTVDLLVYGALARTPSERGRDVLFSGTSLAAAVTSGLAALILSKSPELSLFQLENKLKDLTRPMTVKLH